MVKSLLPTIMFVLGFAGCSVDKTEPAAISDTNVATLSEPNPVATITPSVFAERLRTVVPVLKLNGKQKGRLDASLPPAVRDILEKAETFQILFEERGRDKGNEGNTFEPNYVAAVNSEKDIKSVLEAFYADAVTGELAASCYEPHHGLTATYQGQMVQIEICFDCAIFNVTGTQGRFYGTIVREGRRSEAILDRIIKDSSVPIN